jgi:hypothetical protein
VTGGGAERFVKLSLRLLAGSFLVVGVFFIATPDGTLERITDLGEEIGDFAPAPGTGAKLWLGLAFSYMMVIAAICLVAQMDVVRYRALLLVLALAKTASSLTALGFFLFDDDVFIYLLNFIVDGSLVAAALWLWSLTGRVGAPAAPS